MNVASKETRREVKCKLDNWMDIFIVWWKNYNYEKNKLNFMGT